jgi:glutamyl-tRNA reductase
VRTHAERGRWTCGRRALASAVCRFRHPSRLDPYFWGTSLAEILERALNTGVVIAGGQSAKSPTIPFGPSGKSHTSATILPARPCQFGKFPNLNNLSANYRPLSPNIVVGLAVQMRVGRRLCVWEALRLESNLLVVGISHHTAPVEIRERFSISESRLYTTLHRLAESPGIQEVVLLSTCNRTEFIVWASDLAAASLSIEEFLAAEFSLSGQDANPFYHFTGTEALLHIFRVASSLDSLVVGEPQIVAQVKAAWTKARQAGTTGRFLDRVFQKALGVSKHVRSETAIGDSPVSIPYAAVALARRLFGSFENRKVMLIGSGKMSELSARYLLSAGVGALWVANRTYDRAVALAGELGGAAIRFEDRWEYLAAADIMISSTGCPHIIFDREDAERIRQMRQGRPIFLIDIAVPRDIDPAVRELPGFFLYDIDDLEGVVAGNLGGRLAAAADAEKMVRRETQLFERELDAERVVPTIVALRAHLEEIRRSEIARFQNASSSNAAASNGDALEALTVRIMDRVAGELARELKQTRQKPEQEEMAAALRHLFRLPQSPLSPPAEIDPDPSSTSPA